MDLIDTHCHLDVEDFDADRGAILARCRELGVTAVVVPAIHEAGWEKLLGVCAGDDLLHPALGLHPIYLDRHQDADIRSLEALVADVRPVAIGEIGLDYFVTEPDRARQQALFEAQLAIARDAGLPVILHVRKAHDEVLSTLRRIRVSGGIAHAFSGSEQQARQYIELGFRLGFGGVMTYPRAKKVRRLAAELPLESLVLETDAPDLPPAGHHGERNSPEYLPEILAVLAELRGEEAAALAERTSANARATLPLSDARAGDPRRK